MAYRVRSRAGAAIVCAATALLLAPSLVSAQRWRFGIGAAGGYSMWTPAASPSAGGSVAFDPAPFALGDATLWLRPSLGLRLDASLAQPDLVWRTDGADAS